MGGGDTTQSSEVPTFSVKSVVIEPTDMGAEKEHSFKIDYDKEADYSIAYSENTAEVFTVEFAQGCELNTQKTEIKIKKGGCDVTVKFAPKADEAKNYIGSIQFGSLLISLSGSGKNARGELPPTVDATVNLGLLLYYKSDQSFIAYERINEEVITVKNKTNAPLAIPLTATAVANFNFYAGGVKVKLDTDKFEPDSCFNDNGYRPLGTSPTLTKKLPAGESCRFSVNINFSISDIAAVIQGAKTFTITAANDGVKGTEYIAMFSALRAAVRITDAADKKQTTYSFGTAKVGTESLLSLFTWKGVSTEELTAIEAGKMTRTDSLTFPVNFFTNFVIDKQLTTCSFITTATTTIGIPPPTPRCNVFFRFKPAAVGEITTMFTRTTEGEVFEAFELNGYPFQVGKIPADKFTMTFKGTGN